MNPFVRNLGWLFAALRLQEPEVPRHLHSDGVIPTLDVVQGGLPFAQLGFTDQNFAGAIAAGTDFGTGIPTPGEDEQIIVYLASMHSTNAALGLTSLWIDPPLLAGAGQGIIVSQFTPGANPAAAHWAQISGRSDGIIILPPLHSLGGTFEQGYAVGTTATWRAAWMTLPAGYKWW